MSLIDRVVGTILRYNMFGPGSRVGVAISGGADSVCLLHLLVALQTQWNLNFTILHLNHCIRGAESDADEQFVRDLAGTLGLPCVVSRVDVRSAADNLEQAAREARQEFFRRALADGSVDCVATAHTQSDQAETVLFRILRGSYTTGLAGIRPVTPEGIVRPLLWVTRADVEAYLKGNAMTWREDSSNRDLSFARNRIRHELLPGLTRDWNPQLPSILARHAELAREDDQFWDAEVDRVRPGRLNLTPGQAIWDVRASEDLPPALIRRLIRRAISHVRGNLRQIDFSHIDQILALARGDAAGHSRTQVPGVDVLKSFDWVRFAKPAPVPRPEFHLPLTVPGSVTIPERGSVVFAEVIESQLNLGDRATLEKSLDWSRVRELEAGLHVRNWQPGDRYRRSGHSHEQKLKELFHEFRVPLWERRSWPVLGSGETILWAPQFGPADNFAAGPHTSSILRLTEAKLESGTPQWTSV